MDIRKALAGCAALMAAAWAAEMPLIQPKELAAVLSGSQAKPMLFHVGFATLYRSRHIPGSIYAGPGARAEGLEALRKAAEPLPRGRAIVIYCGCCPWDHCPNVKPAIAVLKEMGFTNVKVLSIPTNFAKDWIELGYPSTSELK